MQIGGTSNRSNSAGGAGSTPRGPGRPPLSEVLIRAEFDINPANLAVSYLQNIFFYTLLETQYIFFIMIVILE